MHYCQCTHHRLKSVEQLFYQLVLSIYLPFQNNEILFLLSVIVIFLLIQIGMSEKFQFQGKLGEGAFATVFKVKRKEDGNIYAFKKIKTLKMSDRELSLALNQIRILASIKSPYIIEYKEAFYDQTLKSLCMVTQLAEGGDLSAKINIAKKTKTTISESFIWKTILQLLHAIKSLHAMKIFHRDIKPANVLLTKDEQCAKLADMNVSVISKTGMATTQTGTPNYASPEVWMERPYSGKSDIWSLGCMIYEMAALRPPFLAADIHSLKKCVTTKEPETIPLCYSKELQAFVKVCLQKDQNLRPSASQLLLMPILKQKSKEYPLQKFNQAYFPSIERNLTMINTIRFQGNSFKSLHNKLPKCNYNCSNNDKQNIMENNSLCAVKVNKNHEKLPPMIKRPQSAGKMKQKIGNLVNRVEVLKKLRV